MEQLEVICHSLLPLEQEIVQKVHPTKLQRIKEFHLLSTSVSF